MLLCIVPGLSAAYAVLTHEAIIDSMWEKDITPTLLRRFPHTSAGQLRTAHGYAYGGAIIQDMGYYPFGSRKFSDLTHYVRSGDFVVAMLKDARDVNEYAFAIGALSHYWADYGGHTIATNASVPLLFPKLRHKYGDNVTFEQNPAAHIQTEFGFDVLQVAQGHYASNAYHHFIGFEVSKPLLERAFRETYGVELKSLFTDLDLAIGTYRHTVSTLIPKMTKAAWEASKQDMAKQGVISPARVTTDSAIVAESSGTTPGTTREQFLFKLSNAEYAKDYGNHYQKPGLGSRILAFLFRLLPKIGPLKSVEVKPSTPETEQLFMRGFLSTTNLYRQSLVRLRENDLTLTDRNFDTGERTVPHEYKLADAAYADLLHALCGNHFTLVTPALRANLVAYYRDTTMLAGSRKDSTAWRHTLADVDALRESAAAVRH